MASHSLSSSAHLDYFERNLIQQQISVLSEGAIESALHHQEFDIEILEAEAIGGSIGSSLGERVAEKVNAQYRSNFYAAYGRAPAQTNYVTQVANQSRAASNANNTASNDPDSSYGSATQAKTDQYSKKLNQFGVFGGGKPTPNQAQYSDQQFEDALQKIEFAEASNSFGSASSVGAYSTATNSNGLQAFNTGVANAQVEVFSSLKAIAEHPIDWLINYYTNPLGMASRRMLALAGGMLETQAALGTALHTGNVNPLLHDMGEFVGNAQISLLTAGLGSTLEAGLGRFGLFGGDVPENAALRQTVLNNIAQSQAASKTSNFLVLAAKEDQILAGYNADNWSMANLSKGDVVYGGLPGQSPYYTSERALLASGYNKDALFQSLQVKADPIRGYRPAVGAYEVANDIRVPYGIVSANPELGVGTGEQYFIGNFSSSLRLVNKIELGENYDYELYTYRPRP